MLCAVNSARVISLQIMECCKEAGLEKQSVVRVRNDVDNAPFEYLAQKIKRCCIADRSARVMSAMAFIRIKLLEAIVDHAKPSEPACSVNVKEAITGDDGAVTFDQRKKMFFPDWDRCFDSHLRARRRMQIIVNDRVDGNLRPLAEVTVETQALASECMQEEPGSAVKLAVRIHPSLCMHVCGCP